MRIAFVPLGVPTHYYDMVPLAWACRAAGHEVRIAAQPGLLGQVTQSGLTGVRIGRDHDIIADLAEFYRQAMQAAKQGAGGEPRIPSAEELRQFREFRFGPYVRSAEAMAGDLVSFARAWQPDLVVADPFVVAAPLASELAGAPLVRHLWGPDMVRLGTFPGYPVPEGSSARDEWPTALIEMFDQHGVEVRGEYAVATVDPCPDRLQIGGIENRIAQRYVPYNGPGPVPEWLVEPPQRPRVCLTWGTIATAFTGSRGFGIPDVLAVLENFDVEVIACVTASDAEQIGKRNNRVRIAERLPLNLVMPSCTAVVHHGGTGAMRVAALNGVPQVQIGAMTDQLFNGRLLTEAGAGIGLNAEEAGTDDVKAAVSAALSDPDIRAAASRLRDEILAQPTPADAVGELENLVRNR
jgi:UDP:flavonoid glycosyltransferase YjiC (YdhE family)